MTLKVLPRKSGNRPLAELSELSAKIVQPNTVKVKVLISHMGHIREIHENVTFATKDMQQNLN